MRWHTTNVEERPGAGEQLISVVSTWQTLDSGDPQPTTGRWRAAGLLSRRSALPSAPDKRGRQTEPSPVRPNRSTAPISAPSPSVQAGRAGINQAFASAPRREFFDGRCTRTECLSSEEASSSTGGGYKFIDCHQKPFK